MEGVNLRRGYLQGAFLQHAHLEGADLYATHLEGVNLRHASLEGKPTPLNMLESLQQSHGHAPATLPPTNLQRVFFDSGTDLEFAQLGNVEYGWVTVADVHWNDTNLTVVNWSQMMMLGDEYAARQGKRNDGKKKDQVTRLREAQRAVRANRQLAVALQGQGLNEQAARFAYRAQVLQKRVLWFQMIQRDMKLRPRAQALGAWLFSWFLFLLAGYGYRLGRSFFAYLLIISSFMTLYHILDPHLAWNEAFVVSMTAFHGRGFFPEQFKPSDPQALAAAIEAFVGLLIEVTFIATLTQRLFGK